MLALAVAAASFWWLLLGDSRLWFGRFPGVTDPVDFTIYYSAARIGLTHGWSHIYDLNLQAQQFGWLHPLRHDFDWSSYYITPPPMAWLMAPLALLPHGPAYYIWILVLGAAYLTAGLLAAPGSPVTRVATVLFGATTFPLLQSLADGQAALLVTAAMVASWLLIEAGRRWAAGLAMIPLLLKPQTAYLVPLSLLILGEFRVAAVAAAGAGVLAVASVTSLGSEGLQHWSGLLAEEPKHLANQEWTPASLVGVGRPALIAEAGFALAGLAVAWLSRGRGRGRGLALTLAAALTASLLAAPYHQASDSVVLVAASWLYLSTKPPAWQLPWLGFGAAAALFAGPWGPDPLLVFAAGWLALMLQTAVVGRHGPRTREPRALPAPAGTG